MKIQYEDTKHQEMKDIANKTNFRDLVPPPKKKNTFLLGLSIDGKSTNKSEAIGVRFLDAKTPGESKPRKRIQRLRISIIEQESKTTIYIYA